MAARTSFYRPTGHTRRNNARQIHDHDVFEGLPIRRWSKEWIWIATPPEAPTIAPSTSASNTIQDLPLPKDTHLLTPMSQTLLQAARNGTLMKPIEETEKEKEAEAHNKDSHRLFRTSKWTVAPRDNEPPEIEYLSTVVRGSKRKINGKFVEIEEEEHLVHHDLTGGIQGMSGGQGMKRRPPPPRRKPGKGRKAGFKKMVSFAEDGRALPAGESGVAAPPPPVPLSPPQEYLNEPIPTSSSFQVKEMKSEPVATEEKVLEGFAETSPSLPPITTTLNDQSIETVTATRLDSDIEMGDATMSSNVNVETHVPHEPIMAKLEEPFTEPTANVTEIPQTQATSISPPHISESSSLPLAVPHPIPPMLPVSKAISPSLPERSPSLPPRPVFSEERPQGRPERPSFLDANRPPGLPPKPAFLDGPKLQLSQSSLPVPPLISSLPSRKADEDEISEGEVEEATS